MATADDIKRVVGLFRVSTEEQEQEGNSLDAQRRMFDMDCRAFGWKSLGIYSGQETGTSLDARLPLGALGRALLLARSLGLFHDRCRQMFHGGKFASGIQNLADSVSQSLSVSFAHCEGEVPKSGRWNLGGKWWARKSPIPGQEWRA